MDSLMDLLPEAGAYGILSFSECTAGVREASSCRCRLIRFSATSPSCASIGTQRPAPHAILQPGTIDYGRRQHLFSIPHRAAAWACPAASSRAGAESRAATQFRKVAVTASSLTTATMRSASTGHVLADRIALVHLPAASSRTIMQEQRCHRTGNPYSPNRIPKSAGWTARSPEYCTGQIGRDWSRCERNHSAQAARRWRCWCCLWLLHLMPTITAAGKKLRPAIMVSLTGLWSRDRVVVTADWTIRPRSATAATSTFFWRRAGDLQTGKTGRNSAAPCPVRLIARTNRRGDPWLLCGLYCSAASR